MKCAVGGGGDAGVEWTEETGPLRINVEDYLGIFEDVPGLRIPPRMRFHNCSFCLFVRQNRQGFRDCFANKRAVNRLLQRRKRHIQGLCHLGLTDLVAPVVVEGLCVAGVFYGSVVVREKEAEARLRLRAYCVRRGFAMSNYLGEFDKIPRVNSDELPVYRRRLDTVASVLARLVLDSGLPLTRYRQEADAETARQRAGYPPVLQAAMRHLERCYAQPLTRESVARHLHCNPGYLSTLFSTYLGVTFLHYLSTIRVNRAKRMLERTTLTAGEIAFAVGFKEQSHFNRRFRDIVGLSPIEYRQSKTGMSAG